MNMPSIGGAARTLAVLTRGARTLEALTLEGLTLKALVLGALTLGAAGCRGAEFGRLLTPQPTPQEAMLVALSDADADVRRRAVARVAESGACNEDWAIDGLMAIALLESDSQARCTAVRTLARVRDPRAVETCLKILHHQNHPPEQVRPPDALCRWDATATLGALHAAGVVPETLHDDVRDALLARLAADASAQVRVAAAEALGGQRSDAVLCGLIAGLRDSDFAVVYACEQSLVRLTGQTHDCRAAEWETWYEANKSAPFAHAGRVPDSRRPLYDGPLEKAWYDTRQLVQWAFPGDKE